MTEPNGSPLLDALTGWQADHALTNADMATAIGISESYWKAIKTGQRALTLVVARQVYHRFDGDDALVIRLLAKRFTDQWFGANPEQTRTAGAD